MLCVARCSLCVVGCLLIVIIVCCSYHVVCCSSYDACRWWLRIVLLLRVECWLLVVACLLRDVRRSLVILVCWGVACCVMDCCCLLFGGCCLFIVCCLVSVVGIMLCVVS